MGVLKRVWVAFFLLLAGVVAGGACGFEPNIADGAFATRRDAVCVTNTPITIAWRATIAAIAGQRMRGFP